MDSIRTVKRPNDFSVHTDLKLARLRGRLKSKNLDVFILTIQIKTFPYRLIFFIFPIVHQLYLSVKTPEF